MKKTMLLFLLSVFVCQLAMGETSEKINTLMAKGDSLSAVWQHQAAADMYLKVVGLDSNQYAALWKAGDQLTETANQLPENKKDEKEALFEQARQLCDKAIQVNPNGWEGHLKLSVVLGRLALFRGGKEKINLSKAVKASADQALVLNPQCDLAHHVLGRWHQNLANLSWALKTAAKIVYGGVPPGTNEEAVEHFKKAIEINPNHIEHYLELAKTYQFMGKKELMKEPLEKLLTLPNVEEKDPEFKKEAKELLKKI